MLWKGQSRSELPHLTDGLHAMMSTPIIIGDYLYGVDSYGELRGIDAATGERLWQSEGVTPQGSVWDGVFCSETVTDTFVTNDAGELVIARFSPEGYEEIDRTSLLAPTLNTQGGASGRWSDRSVLWSHPAFAKRACRRPERPRGDPCLARRRRLRGRLVHRRRDEVKGLGFVGTAWRKAPRRVIRLCGEKRELGSASAGPRTLADGLEALLAPCQRAPLATHLGQCGCWSQNVVRSPRCDPEKDMPRVLLIAALVMLIAGPAGAQDAPRRFCRPPPTPWA